jgi:hypothetical protein
MGHLASFPFNSYCTKIRREYMLLFSPVLELRAGLSAKVYINGSTTFSGLGPFRSAHLANKKAQFKVQTWSILLKTNAYKWYGEHHARFAQKSRVAENTGFSSWGMDLSNQHFCNVRRILDTNTRTT